MKIQDFPPSAKPTRAGFSRGDQFYASYPAGSELLTDTTKLYKSALGNCFELEEWGPIEWAIMSKHFERQGKSPYAYHAVPGSDGVLLDVGFLKMTFCYYIFSVWPNWWLTLMCNTRLTLPLVDILMEVANQGYESKI
ncbi:hypothetical protein Tco_0077443 [Tanacetum coccineum]